MLQFSCRRVSTILPIFPCAGQLKVLDPEGQPLKEFNLYKQNHGLYDLGRVRGFKALCVDKVRASSSIA